MLIFVVYRQEMRKLLLYFFFIISTSFCAAQSVRINEVQASNATSFIDNAGDFDDWIELYNNSDEEISLNGWHLSDDPNNLTKWTFPDEPEIELEPGEFLILIADGEEDEGALHLNFSLSQTGEQLFLSQAIGTPIHQVVYEFNWQDYSWGYDQNNTWGLLEQASPNEQNNSFALNGSADPAVYSQVGALLSAPFELILNAAPGNSIYYTTDGTIPDETSTLYSSPIPISENSTVRSRVFETGKHPSKISAHSYLFESNINNPVIHLACEPETFNGPNGIDNNAFSDTEIIVDAVFFDEFGNQSHQQMMGLKVHAADFRDQRSFRLYARGEYGESLLEMPVFSDRDYSDYKRLILRNSGNDGIEIAGAGLRDVLIHDLYRSIDDSYGVSASKAVNLFVNGEFWGLYNLRERQDRHWLNSVYGIEEDEVDFLERTAGEPDTRDELAGDWDEFDLFEQSAIDLDLSDNENYNTFIQEMNLRNFIDYQALEIYIVNQDWLSNNMKFYKTHDPEGKWNWVIWDTDWGFGTYYPAYPHGFPTWNALNFATSIWGGWTADVETELLQNLIENESFVADFSTRSADLMNSFLKPERVINQLLVRKEIIEADVPRQIEKWGGTFNNWEAETEYMASFIADRAFHNRQHYAEKFGLGEILEITIDALPQNAGYIEVNTIETDEIPWSGYYFQNLPVRLKAMPYPGFVFDHWEGNNIPNPLSSEIIINIEESPNLTAVYLINEDEVNPIINEIKHASGGINNPGDWIELYNPSSSPLDISAWEFCANNDCFELPEGSIIPAQSFIILALDLSDFQSQYPGVAVLNAQFNFGLSQNGELLTLKDDQGFVRDLVDYETQSPWPAPVLQNHSIELIDPVLDNSLGENWMTQNKLPYGSPGAENVLIPINVADFEAQQNIKVFPNPFSDFLALQLAELPKGNYELSVRDLLGQTVRHLAQYIGEDELIILRDLDNLSPGLYLLEISNGKSSFQVKVLKR